VPDDDDIQTFGGFLDVRVHAVTLYLALHVAVFA
jgi:hypothetical protein